MNVRRFGAPPRPVATTVTHTWPASRSSTVAPKMMFVSSTAAWLIDLGCLVDLVQRQVLAARDREQDAAGPAISVSISGDLSARSAASRARFSPVA